MSSADPPERVALSTKILFGYGSSPEAVLSRYPITRSRHREILAELERRRGEAG